ncbi:MAG TPA: phospholipase D-like domain-containing protein [Phycisphaerae bacterium]|nr:phospholipase D-like domain-containing protein [Phycisphaerae bacterium]
MPPPRRLAAGVNIFEYRPSMFHCKLLIVDDQWVSLGSSNLDDPSFRLNDEANLDILDPAFAHSQTAIFQQDKSHSRQITYPLWQHRPLWEKLTGTATNLFGDEM